VVESTDALMDRRASTTEADFARGVQAYPPDHRFYSARNGRRSGNRIRAWLPRTLRSFWDGSSIGKHTGSPLEEQSARSWRSGGLPNQLTRASKAKPSYCHH